jgi:hypothetical protein
MTKNIYIALTLFVMASLPLQDTHASGIAQTTTNKTMAPKTQARAFFVNLKNNDKVAKTFTVKFGIEGMKIAPAGTSIPETGHFHLLVDAAPLTGDQLKNPIPADMKHIHFGKGQTETSLTLTPGKHTLQLVMGDGAHKLHNPPVMSDVITVIVE